MDEIDFFDLGLFSFALPLFISHFRTSHKLKIAILNASLAYIALLDIFLSFPPFFLVLLSHIISITAARYFSQSISRWIHKFYFLKPHTAACTTTIVIAKSYIPMEVGWSGGGEDAGRLLSSTEVGW